jgi:hypothetical protein
VAVGGEERGRTSESLGRHQWAFQEEVILSVGVQALEGDPRIESTFMEGDIRDEALDILQEAMAWRLPIHRWNAVSRALDVLDAALHEDATDRVREAVHGLELAGPIRATRLEDTSALPPSSPIRLRINELVHSLRSERRPSGQDPDPKGRAATGAE